MSSAEVPPSLSALTAAWFSSALETDVTGVEFETLAVAGATGDLARARLTYVEAGSGPATVIAKIRGTAEVKVAMDSALGLYARERQLYTELATTLPVATPRCFFAGDGDTTPLLLEDLAALRSEDQVAGLSLADAETLMDALAEMHATHWGGPAPGGESWLLSLSDPLYGGMVTQLVMSGIEPLQERFAGELDQADLDTLAAAAPRWAEMVARCDEGPATLVHNDCRLDNIFFDPDGSPVFLDWQLCAWTRGTQDVAYLLSGSMGEELLCERWRDLLRRYHEGLVARGVANYSWDECCEHYRENLLYTLAPGVALLGAMRIGADERGLGETLARRTFVHAADLDSFALLSGL